MIYLWHESNKLHSFIHGDMLDKDSSVPKASLYGSVYGYGYMRGEIKMLNRKEIGTHKNSSRQRH